MVPFPGAGNRVSFCVYASVLFAFLLRSYSCYCSVLLLLCGCLSLFTTWGERFSLQILRVLLRQGQPLQGAILSTHIITYPRCKKKEERENYQQSRQAFLLKLLYQSERREIVPQRTPPSPLLLSKARESSRLVKS